MESEKIVIQLKERMAVLTVQPFDSDIDVDSLLKIDYSNILGEILTFPVIFNRIANMRAELTNLLNLSKVDVDVYEAQLYEELQKKMIATETKKPSIKDVEQAILRDSRFLLKKKAHINLQRDFDYIDALYWSAKSKDTKLDKLTDKVRPEEFENDILEGTINGVMIKMTKKSIA